MNLTEKANMLLNEAERRLEEAVKNGQAPDIQFWRGYRECAMRLVEATK